VEMVSTISAFLQENNSMKNQFNQKRKISQNNIIGFEYYVNHSGQLVENQVDTTNGNLLDRKELGFVKDETEAKRRFDEIVSKTDAAAYDIEYGDFSTLRIYPR
jgi:hypothetical protein